MINKLKREIIDHNSINRYLINILIMDRYLKEQDLILSLDNSGLYRRYLQAMNNMYASVDRHFCLAVVPPSGDVSVPIDPDRVKPSLRHIDRQNRFGNLHLYKGDIASPFSTLRNNHYYTSAQYKIAALTVDELPATFITNYFEIDFGPTKPDDAGLIFYCSDGAGLNYSKAINFGISAMTKTDFPTGSNIYRFRKTPQNATNHDFYTFLTNYISYMHMARPSGDTAKYAMLACDGDKLWYGRASELTHLPTWFLLAERHVFPGTLRVATFSSRGTNIGTITHDFKLTSPDYTLETI